MSPEQARLEEREAVVAFLRAFSQEAGKTKGEVAIIGGLAAARIAQAIERGDHLK